MPTRVDEAGVERRLKQIEAIKVKKATVKEIGGLKGNPSWVPMKEILDQFIRNQDKLIELYLDSNQDDAFVECKKARAVKLAMTAFYNFVENNETSISELDTEISKIQKQISSIEAGELI